MPGVEGPGPSTSVGLFDYLAAVSLVNALTQLLPAAAFRGHMPGVLIASAVSLSYSAYVYRRLGDE